MAALNQKSSARWSWGCKRQAGVLRSNLFVQYEQC